MARSVLDDDGPTPDGRSETGEAEADPTSALPKDDIFHLLQNSRRRSTLRRLEQWDGRGTIGPLAEHIAAEEAAVTTDELTSSQRSRVYIALYQSHLPKLADHGVISYNQARGTVELTEAADDLFPYLELAQSDDSRTPGRGVIGSAIRTTLDHLP